VISDKYGTMDCGIAHFVGDHTQLSQPRQTGVNA
jgi:hypothetical protein